MQNRADNLNGQIESFVYDGLNRLVDWTINNTVTHSINYYNNLIEQKTDIAGLERMNYSESGKPPHAVSSIDFTENKIPDILHTDSVMITYTDFKKVATLTDNNNFYGITYGVDEQRRKSVLINKDTILSTHYYFGDYEHEIEKNGNIRQIHYLRGAVYVHNSNKPDEFYYTYTDYLGSLTALTDETGTVKERYAYDPWGKRRNPDKWTLSDTRISFALNRGYTGHEHIDAFGVINMNGRVWHFFLPE